jgi:hypothetical protein
MLWSLRTFPSMTNPRSIPKTNRPWPPPGHTTSGTVRTGECNREMPGLPYPAFRRVKAERGDVEPPPYGARPCGHRGPEERDLYPRGSAGPALRPCGSSSGAGSCRAAKKIIRILRGRPAQTTARWKSRQAGERALRYISSVERFANRPGFRSEIFDSAPDFPPHGEGFPTFCPHGQIVASMRILFLTRQVAMIC